MTGGASGALVQDWPNPDAGYVYAVTSRRTLSDAPALIAVPDGVGFESMYKQMG